MSPAHILAVASGKGGVGKSVVALNMSVALARRGRRVLLIDADWGLGDIAALVGMSPEHTIEEVVQGRCSVEEAVVEGPASVSILPASADRDAAFWENGEIDGTALSLLDGFVDRFDCVVIDTGAGISARSVAFVGAAYEALLLITPEPTAIADSYATLKAVLRRNPELEVGLVVNMADSPEEAQDLYVKFRQIVRRFLGAEIDNRGYIPLDRYVREAVKRQSPFVLASPPPPAAEAVVAIAESLLEREERKGASGEGLFARLL